MHRKWYVGLGAFATVLSAIASAASDTSKEVRTTACKGYVDFHAGNELIARYQYNTELSDAQPILWPLHAPGGVTVTRAWPMEDLKPGGSTDHPHHRSVWFCHGDVIPEGLEVKQKIRGVKGVDFWTVAPGHGRIVCTKVQEAGHGRIDTQNEWRTADGVKILDETRTVAAHDFGKARLFVFDIDLHATVVPITFGDTKEGSLGLRVSDVLREEKGNGKLQNAEGKVGEKGCWGQHSAWCDYSGPVDGKAVGIAILDDPKNPSPVCWHSRGYGLMAANPFGRDESRFPAVKGRTDLVRLAKGEHLRLRYGVLLHTGDAVQGNVVEHYQRFVQLRAKE